MGLKTFGRYHIVTREEIKNNYYEYIGENKLWKLNKTWILMI